MKNKYCILLIITIIIGLAILGSIYAKQYRTKSNNEIIVELSCSDMEYKNNIKYKKIELTSKQQEELVEFYLKTDTTKQDVDLAFLETVKLEFSDGNTIIMDKNDDCFAKYNGEYIIKISSQFKEYILKLLIK